MVYIYKEYKHIFDTPAKKEQESVIVNKIMDLLNKNKYDSIHDFFKKNETYQDFLKKNELENVVKHFGNTLNESDYIKIVHEVINLTSKKASFEKENIKTTHIDNKEFNSYKGEDKTFFFDNSNSSMSIERQMEELQKTQSNFQTDNEKKNTENIMKELEKEKKESLNLKHLNDIDTNNLNSEQIEIFSTALNYQFNNQTPIMVDLDRGIIADELNNISKIEKTPNGFMILNDENQQKEHIEQKQIVKTKTLAINPNTIYSNNN